MTEQEHNNEQCTMNNVQWRKVKLGEVAKTFTGLTYSPNCIDKSGTLVLRSSNIKDGQLCFEDNVFVSMDIPERAIIQENDILICVRNGSRNLIGKSALITKDAVGMAFGAFMTVLRTNIIDPKLLLYIWQSNNIQRQVANNIGATINQITNADFNRFEISYPESLPAQRRIAAILASADKVIAATQKTIAKYKQIKQGMMEDLLNEQCTMNNEQWVQKTLIELADYHNGMAFKPSDWANDGVKIIRIEQLNNPLGKYDYYQGMFPETSAIHNGDLIFSWSATLKVVIWQWGDGVLNQHLFKVVPASNVDKHFLYYLLDYNMPKLGESSHGSTMKHIKRKELETHTVYIPRKIAEQKRIASILSSIDSKIECEQSILNKYIQVKKGLMEKLLNDNK